MKWKTITPESALIMKGIAILMIATHNFMHLFPLPKENEFDFSYERTTSMVNLLWTEPENSIRVLLSFFGHFGVEVFIFLSAYGLSKKYLNHSLEYWTYIRERVTKIFPAFIIAIAVWLCLEGFYSHGLLGPLKMLNMHFQDILLKLTLVSNFLPAKAQEPIGPWWFIPFIFQFYLTFPFLLKVYDRWQINGLIAISVIGLALSTAVGGNLAGVNLYYTILPYIPVFSLGIYLAKNDENSKMEIQTSVILLTLVIFISGSIDKHLWVLSHYTFTILFLVTMTMIIPKIKGKLYELLIFTGQISMGLFLVNGFLRFPMVRWAIAEDNWFLTLTLCLVFLVISYAVAITVLRIEGILTEKVKSLRYNHSHVS